MKLRWKLSKNKRTNISEPLTKPSEASLAALDKKLASLNEDDYLYWHAPPLRLMSVFDDFKYDRADVDILSYRMRRHVINALKGIGCETVNGHTLVHGETGVRFIIPKFVALGASPFHVTRYHDRQPNDYWILTPTQAVCYLLNHLSKDDALAGIEALLHRQPLNLYKIVDYIEHKRNHHAYSNTLKHFELLQETAISNAPLHKLRAL